MGLPCRHLTPFTRCLRHHPRVKKVNCYGRGSETDDGGKQEGCSEGRLNKIKKFLLSFWPSPLWEADREINPASEWMDEGWKIGQRETHYDDSAGCLRRCSVCSRLCFLFSFFFFLTFPLLTSPVLTLFYHFVYSPNLSDYRHKNLACCDLQHPTRLSVLPWHSASCSLRLVSLRCP